MSEAFDQIIRVVWASYEDPSKPEAIHNRILRASDYIAANQIAGLTNSSTRERS